ncbi:MAG: monovalent cation/H+ antiporter complex subunit F [Bryobacteraceae bacterium]
MNAWILSAIVMLVAMIPCFARCLRGDTVSRLVGLSAGSTMTAIVLLLLAEGFHRIPFVDLALTLALLSFGGVLVFARFLERWL